MRKDSIGNAFANLASSADHQTIVSSPDGALAFHLERIKKGLCVVRHRLKDRPRVRLRQTALFSDSESFERWMDLDDGRFDYPMVHLSARKAGAQLLEAASRGPNG